MTPESDQYENVCKTRFDEQHALLKRIDTAIRGNGQLGINTRLDRLERFDKVWSKLGWLVAGGGVVMILTHFFG